MKRIFVFGTVFVMSFMIGLGAVVFTSAPAEAYQPCKTILPCSPLNIYCTQIPCDGSGKCRTFGAKFYCLPEWTEYCSADWLAVPCL